ncbi:PspC domain-containing protein [Enemella sp. A6]|uniref:PspC domain-containing protein n=1 Tax=Enemella sp. A6 TaxID=3440152 RepID=UPI003EBE4E75
MNPPAKQLVRSETDRMLSGVCGGIAEYMNIDATLVRLGVAVISLFTGVGILAYLVGWLVIPTASGGSVINPSQNPQAFPAYRDDAADKSPLDDIYGDQPGTQGPGYQQSPNPNDKPFAN